MSEAEQFSRQALVCITQVHRNSEKIRRFYKEQGLWDQARIKANVTLMERLQANIAKAEVYSQ